VHKRRGKRALAALFDGFELRGAAMLPDFANLYIEPAINAKTIKDNLSCWACFGTRSSSAELPPPNKMLTAIRNDE